MPLKVNFWNDRVTSITFLGNQNREIPDIVNYSNVFLRDASQTPDSVETATGLKLFSTGSIARNIAPKNPPSVTTSGTEPAITIEWDDGNVSTYPESFLRKYSTSATRRSGKFYEEDEQPWTNQVIEKKKSSLVIAYDNFINDEKSLHQAFKGLNHYGVCIVKDIPTNSTKEYGKSSLESIASRIGYLKETIFGRYFDVVSKKESENLVTSNKMFHLHQDLLFYESPPAIKVLEAIKNNVTEGGENIFVDLFSAAKYVQETDPHCYSALCHTPVNFRYISKSGHQFLYTRPMIVEDLDHIDPSTNHPFIREVNYSPPNQAPFEYGITSPLKKMGQFADWENLEQYHSAKDTGDRYIFRDFHRGLKIFEKFINDEDNQFKVLLKQGEAILFNNRRLAHARTQFVDENGGGRWFRVGYMDFDIYYSRLRYLYEKYGP
ncbi:hypothetical protein DASC09_052840 [Saccharomycopsis crataegensis]|uniref:TauD/TfdA-like domain-containing protein n=1 Tax=Saccharomycopsis crataegensis TaxID=43959 RepID=A0AAV5QT99_9ASCO|nr:hypothetical protein DASC09_052840 [Saccharomycopsis crataegensis]